MTTTRCKICDRTYLEATCPQCGLGRNESATVNTLHFGKHKGLTIEEVLKVSPSYLSWMLSHGAGTPAQRAKARWLLVRKAAGYEPTPPKTEFFSTPVPKAKPSNYTSFSQTKDNGSQQFYVEDFGSPDLNIFVNSQVRASLPQTAVQQQPVTSKVVIPTPEPVFKPQPTRQITRQVYQAKSVSQTINQPIITKKSKGQSWGVNFLRGLAAIFGFFVILGFISSNLNKNTTQPETATRVYPTPTAVVLPTTTPLPAQPKPTSQAPTQPQPTQPAGQLPAQPQQPDLTQAQVVNVVDGDTIDVFTLGTGTMRIRLIGMDTPETKDPNRPVMCFGQEATNKTQELLNQSNNQVFLEKDFSETDRYGRFLRYIWITEPDGKLYMLNEELVRWGFAQAATYPPDIKYQTRFVNLTSEARNANRGLWSFCGSFGVPLAISTPTPEPPPPPAQEPERGVTDESYPCLEGQIKGNNNSGIYHMPYQEFYAITRDNVQCFDSESAAIQAGFRKAKV